LGLDRLFVASQALTAACKGTTFIYQLIAA
jgi:hypothetical protein